MKHGRISSLLSRSCALNPCDPCEARNQFIPHSPPVPQIPNSRVRGSLERRLQYPMTDFDSSVLLPSSSHFHTLTHSITYLQTTPHTLRFIAAHKEHLNLTFATGNPDLSSLPSSLGHSPASVGNALELSTG